MVTAATRNVEAARRELGKKAEVVSSDIAEMSDIAALALRVADGIGHIDFLFVNAGYSRLDPVAEVSEEIYDRTFAINTKGCVLHRAAPDAADARWRLDRFHDIGCQ